MSAASVTSVTQALGAAKAAMGLLPAANQLTVADPVTDPQAASLPGQAVVAKFAGTARGSVAIVVGQDLVDALASTPIGALDLTQAIRPAIEAAATTLGPVVVDPGQLVDSDPAMASVVAEGGQLVPLVGGGEVRAVVALSVTARVADPESPSVVRSTGLDLLHDVEMEVTAELGRSRMSVRELLELLPGKVVELDRAAGGPADLLVNGRMIARGEVVVIDENFGIRITEIVPQTERA